ncbi:MAG TPA: peptidylprolyl isomerase [Steroidobacteraceae bacterium]|nr:peptidylprolyl isomerase [Steroidobacteraceae bacterium]
MAAKRSGSEASRRTILAGMASWCVSLPLLAGRTRSRRPREVRVVLTTALGAIEVAVDPARAPISAGDFLRYVDRRLFDGSAFYRTVRPDNDINPVKIDVIQGGLVNDRKLLPPIPHEPTNKTGIHHRNGTISIARDEPGTGSAGAFFICIGDQPQLDFGGRRNPDRQGFAAFGRVVHGMDVVRAIWKSKTALLPGMGGQKLMPPIGILTARRI